MIVETHRLSSSPLPLSSQHMTRHYYRGNGTLEAPLQTSILDVASTSGQKKGEGGRGEGATSSAHRERKTSTRTKDLFDRDRFRVRHLFERFRDSVTCVNPRLPPRLLSLTHTIFTSRCVRESLYSRKRTNERLGMRRKDGRTARS